jgi:RNA polymerase sigma factor (TIGR02999 family)
MADAAAEDITALLLDWGNGDRAALDRLVTVLHREFRRIASRQMRRERSSASIHTTALVNEAYLRLVDYKRVQARDRAHFLAIAAQAMRRILVERARGARAAKRGGSAAHVPLDDAAAVPLEQSVELLALDAALSRLAAFDPRKARIVELKYFGGLTIDETAAVVGVSTPTVEREWRTAKLWLYREIQAETTQ